MNLPDIIAAIRAAEAKATLGKRYRKWIESVAGSWSEGAGNINVPIHALESLLEQRLALCDAAEERDSWKLTSQGLEVAYMLSEKQLSNVLAERDALKAEVAKLIEERDRARQYFAEEARDHESED